MKKTIFALILILCTGVLSACSGGTDADESTVFIEKKGNIVSVDVEELDKEYYSSEELESYVSDHLEEYTKINGETVEKVSLDVEGNVAKLKMKYESCEDYAAFNGIELYTGTVVTAQAEGYDFNTEYYSVSKESIEEGGKASTKEEVLADDDNKVAIIKANVNVQVPGTILYVSAKDTKMIDKDTVSITGEGANEEAELTYIIYK